MNDITAFVLALLDEQAFSNTYPRCDICNADFTSDNLVNGLDVQVFVDLIQ